MLLKAFEAAFLVCAVLVFYVYAGFPILLCLIGRLRRQPAAPPEASDDELPTVSVLVAAYNEEAVIETKLRNCLSLDYPDARLEFVFVSDSTDGTNAILRRYESDRVKVVILPERRGKLEALKAAFPLCRGAILVFSDANTYFRPDTIRRLVRHFRDAHVGAVTGDVRLLPSGQTFSAGEGAYYRYERWLQVLETRFWSTVGIDGGMYALRRELHRPPTNGLIADDLVTGMNVACQGFRVIYDPDAIAEEDSAPSDGLEFKRKIRVVAFAIQSVRAGEGFPSIRQFRLWWVFVSHKLLRWFVPVFLLVALASSTVAATGSALWAWIWGMQVAVYLMAAASWRYPRLTGRPFRISYYFAMVNLAALLGLRRGFRGGQAAAWARTERAA